MRDVQPKITSADSFQTGNYSGHDPGDDRQAILQDVLQTREVRQLLKTVLPEFFKVWAGSSWWRRMISKATGNSVVKQLSCQKDELGKSEINRLFEDKRFINTIVDALPGLINGFSEALETSGQTLENISTNDKKALLAGLFSKNSQGRTGSLLTSCSRILNDIHQDDPEFLARILEPGFKQWIENLDFGELKEALENSGQDARALVTMANTVIWEYPAKVVLLLSLLPTLANMTAGAVEISVGKLNSVPPDLLTDIVLAFLNEIDGGTVARIIDQLTEVIRKIHTGSALLGEPGAQQFPKVLADIFATVIIQTKPATFWKAKIALAELKAIYDQEWSRAVNNQPEYARLGLINRPELFNICMRSRNQTMTSWDAMGDDELAGAIAQFLPAYDVEETAEVFNSVLALANRMCAARPDICAELVRQFIDTVDHEELAGMARHVLGEMRAELRPAARAVVPGLVEWVCDTLQPTDDEFEEDAARARGALRALLTTEEV